ncbi:hypothetical protein FGO68_gene1161 [Halteria grandinella]|uniref:Uncharacterized protein n=1 Tax=Halteria grandinella TaxID=5974 RepID=A0A8J8PA52_HALGN|nr:hypothetical protein FGO68_gene1161 [Halteria grandinella]
MYLLSSLSGMLSQMVLTVSSHQIHPAQSKTRPVAKSKTQLWQILIQAIHPSTAHNPQQTFSPPNRVAIQTPPAPSSTCSQTRQEQTQKRQMNQSQ